MRLGIPLVAFFQGVVALIGFLIVGVPDPFFWFVITGIGAMVPFIGTAIGIVPVAILLIFSGHGMAGDVYPYLRLCYRWDHR